MSAGSGSTPAAQGLHGTRESTVPSSTSEPGSEAIRARAFETLVRAWGYLEEAQLLQAQDLWEPALEALGQSLRAAAQSLAILHTASPEAIPQLALLRHLIATEQHFQGCSWSELEALWNRSSASALPEGSSRASDPFRATQALKGLLESTEIYYSLLRRQMYDTDRDHQRRRNLLLIVLAGICLVLAGLYGRYAYLKPTRVYITHGQAFWTSEEHEESESYSLRFPVLLDGAFHEYALPLGGPEAMDTLRIDPVMEADAEVRIERIEIYLQGQTTPRVVRFDQPDVWEGNQDLGPTTIEDGTLHFRTEGNDPFFRISQLDQDEVVVIWFRMSACLPDRLQRDQCARFRPRFLQWLLGTPALPKAPTPEP